MEFSIVDCKILTSSDGLNMDFIPKMLRRRLSQNIRLALCAANSMNAPQGSRSVFASRFGEWQATAKLLTTYCQEDSFSPAGFGLSVHNVAAGLFSLITANTSSYISLAAIDATFSMGLLEACMGLVNCEYMLYVCSEEAQPEIYNDIADISPFAIAMLLGRDSKNAMCRVHCDYEENDIEDNPAMFADFVKTDIQSFKCKKLSMEKCKC